MSTRALLNLTPTLVGNGKGGHTVRWSIGAMVHTRDFGIDRAKAEAFAAADPDVRAAFVAMLMRNAGRA